MKTLTTYDQQAIDFLKKTGATIEIKFLKHDKYFSDDKESRDVYSVTIRRGSRSMTFYFGQSLNDSGFYYKKGVQKTQIDRKYLGNKNLKALIRSKDYSFSPQSDTIHIPKEPSEYSIIACLTKHNPGTFEDFCSELGYDTDSKKAEKTYLAVREEYFSLANLFNQNEMEEMQEIN